MPKGLKLGAKKERKRELLKNILEGRGLVEEEEGLNGNCSEGKRAGKICKRSILCSLQGTLKNACGGPGEEGRPRVEVNKNEKKLLGTGTARENRHEKSL